MLRKETQVKCRKCKHKYRPKEFIASSKARVEGYGWRTTVSTICPKCGYENYQK